MRYLYACALCATAGWATMVHAEDGFCAITSISGEGASVLRQGRILAAVQAMPLSDGDQVATSAGVRMVISCADETRMTVGPDTTVDLGDMTPREQGWAAFLLEGIAAFARPVFGGARFEVRTPSAVASVRSTEWIVEVEAGATAAAYRSRRARGVPCSTGARAST